MKRIVLLLLIAQTSFAIDFNDPQALVARAVEEHPSLARLRAEAAAARERIAPAAALPDPMLMAGVQNKQIDLRDDEMMTMYMLGASQTITRPSRREARGNVAELAARAIETQIDSFRAEVERDVLVAWHDLAAVDGELKTTREVRELVDAIIATARVRYEVGGAAQADVIRAQLQQSELDREIVRLRGARRTVLARLLPLVGLPVDTEVPAVSHAEARTRPAIDAAPVPPEDHPALVAVRTDLARAEEEIELARLELRPDVDVEAQYGYRRMQRDMFSVVARVELPFRREQTIEPRIRGAILRRDAAQSRIGEVRRDLTRALAESAAIHAEAAEQLVLLDQVLLPQARLAFESTLAAYQTGRAPFDAILATETAYLRLRLQQIELLARRAQAAINFEALRNGARTASMSPSATFAPAAAPESGSAAMGNM